MFARIALRCIAKGLAWFAAIAVVSGFYFGQVDVAGFQLGLGHSQIQTEQGIDPDAYNRAHGNGDWR